jgi:hypothetical protein
VKPPIRYGRTGAVASMTPPPTTAAPRIAGPRRHVAPPSRRARMAASLLSADMAAKGLKRIAACRQDPERPAISMR